MDQKILQLLNYASTNDKAYNGAEYEGGYHTLKIKDILIKGQRNPEIRFKNLNFDFTNKTVLDIGSNQGGMLFEIQGFIKEGIGLDIDKNLVNVSNKITKFCRYDNLSFYVFDVETENLEIIKSFFNNDIDVIFLLSVCMWINNWKDVIKWCYENSMYCFFETNGKQKVQEEQLSFLKSLYRQVTVVNETSDDDPGQKKRISVWCKK
jgi:SAM-dependent methyltransferase